MVMLTLQVRRIQRTSCFQWRRKDNNNHGKGPGKRDRRPTTCWLKLLKQKRKDSKNRETLEHSSGGGSGGSKQIIAMQKY